MLGVTRPKDTLVTLVDRKRERQREPGPDPAAHARSAPAAQPVLRSGVHATSFRVLRRRDYAIFWSAALVSNTGSWMQTIAVPFVIYELTHSTTWLGVAAFATFVPAVVMSPVAGSLADRVSRKQILLCTQTAMMLAAFALFAIWTAGIATPGLIVAIVLASGLAAGLNITTWQSFVPQLVEPDELVDAVRLNSMQFMGARAFGPALAGVVLQAFGAGMAFLLNAISFVLVLVALVVIRPRVVARSTEAGHVIGHFRAGWRYVRARRALVLAVGLITVTSLLGTSVIQLAPALARDEFDVGRGAYGFLVAAFGAGAIAGSITVALIADRRRRSAVARVGGTALGAGVVLLGVAPSYAVGVVALLLMGISYVLMATTLNTSLQARVDDTYRGRAISIYLSGLLLGVPVGALIEGKLASVVGLRPVVAGAGAMLVGLLGLAMMSFDRLRPLDEDLIPVHADPFLSGQPTIAGAD